MAPRPWVASSVLAGLCLAFGEDIEDRPDRGGSAQDDQAGS